MDKNMPKSREFTFFLDAWNFCQSAGLDWEKSIKRKDWATWCVVY
jgi:hypothetical protein